MTSYRNISRNALCRLQEASLKDSQCGCCALLFVAFYYLKYRYDGWNLGWHNGRMRMKTRRQVGQLSWKKLSAFNDFLKWADQPGTVYFATLFLYGRNHVNANVSWYNYYVKLDEVPQKVKNRAIIRLSHLTSGYIYKGNENSTE